MAFLDLVDRSGRIQLQARVDVLGEETFERLLEPRPRRPDRRRRHRLRARAAASCRCASTDFDGAGQVAAPAAREAPRAHGRRDALPPARARPDRQRGDARALHHAREGHHRDPPLPRRARLHRGRDAGAAAALRRRAGAAVHDAPQRARPHAVPAHRHRALPQAPDRRRPRARLRARQGLPQRGHLAQAQPRVHDARVVRGLRRLRRRRPSAASSWSPTSPSRSATRARSTSARRGGARRCAGAIQDADRHRHPRATATCESLRAAIARARPRASPERGDLGPARRRPALQARRADADPADVPARLPGRALAVRQAPPLQGGAGRALRGLRRRDGDRQRVHRAQRPRRPARALRGAGRATPRRATRRRSRSTRTTSRRSSTACRRPAASASGSTAW